MHRLRGLAILMCFSILAITAFQLYWLKQNYEREKKNLYTKCDIAFHETIRHLQASKLNLEFILPDSLQKNDVRFFVNENNDGPVTFPGYKKRTVPVGAKKEIFSTINILEDKLGDSLRRKQPFKPGVVIAMNKGAFVYRKDSAGGRDLGIPNPKEEYFFRILSHVDSLQDTLKVKEITSSLVQVLKDQKANVPFLVKRLDSCAAVDDPGPNTVTIGFVHPITYQFDIGNTFPYLMRRISTPILFSVFLIGFTILSFVLLYRSLLRQRRLAELKNDLISNITHELKTPIATVGVAIEALRNFNAMEDMQKTKEYLDISQNELQRLGLLVDKVLKLSMFEKKEIDLKYEPLNLKDLVDEVISSMRLQIEKHHANILVRQTGDTNLSGDRLHLLSVVFNLLDNALKYNSGDPEIRIEIRQNENNIVLSISDNGIGIPEQYKSKLFEKFFRVPAGDTHNSKGYGLGLSYAAHVVQKHKGSISVESRPGEGSTFIITLPKQQS